VRCACPSTWRARDGSFRVADPLLQFQRLGRGDECSARVALRERDLADLGERDAEHMEVTAAASVLGAFVGNARGGVIVAVEERARL
jgi:hypothetical protein